MLIEFSVANYRSFREKVTLSMVASSDDTLADNTFAAPGRRGMRLLKSAALYGANASGKSNLLRALRTMHDLVRGSASRMQRGDPLPAEPFKLDPATMNEPSLFEVVIATDEQRYLYGLTLDRERVHEEWLTATRLTGQREVARMLFERAADGSVEFGDSWRGERATLVERVRENALLLSVAVQTNQESARPVFDWFKDRLWWIPTPWGSSDAPFETMRRIKDDPAFARDVARLLVGADVAVERLELSEHPMAPESDEGPEAASSLLREFNELFERHLGHILGESRALTVPSLSVIRRRIDGREAAFELSEESGGTRRLIGLAAPWLQCLARRRTLLIDEFESSLHPHIARQLLKSLHANEGTAQLIFTTHDTNLLDPELLRRDQIWFTERSPEGATSLYSLWDFKPRKGENFRKGYLNGRYGAVPFLGDWSFGTEETAERAPAE